MDVAIVSLLSAILATLLVMPWWFFRMLDSLRKDLIAKIEESEAKTAAKFADLETRTDAKFADLEAKLTARIDRLEAGTDAKFANLETKLTSKIDGLRREVTELSERVTKLSERVARIEGYLFGIEPPAQDGPGDGGNRPEPPVA